MTRRILQVDHTTRELGGDDTASDAGPDATRNWYAVFEDYRKAAAERRDRVDIAVRIHDRAAADADGHAIRRRRAG